jgi:hypothetical protein
VSLEQASDGKRLERKTVFPIFLLSCCAGAVACYFLQQISRKTRMDAGFVAYYASATVLIFRLSLYFPCYSEICVGRLVQIRLHPQLAICILFHLLGIRLSKDSEAKGGGIPIAFRSRYPWSIVLLHFKRVRCSLYP